MISYVSNIYRYTYLHTYSFLKVVDYDKPMNHFHGKAKYAASKTEILESQCLDTFPAWQTHDLNSLLKSNKTIIIIYTEPTNLSEVGILPNK